MIKVYLMKTEEFKNEEKFRQGCGLVDSVRLQKIKKCRATEDKVRSLCCGLLLQYAVKEELEAEKLPVGKIPMELCYGISQHGKPYFTDFPGLYFNLSHSGEYTALVVSKQEVGIDIQQKRSVKDRMVQKVLSKSEYERYKALQKEESDAQEQPGDNGQNWFFRCWCAKESYGKLTGMGLLQGFDTMVYEPEQKRMSDTMGNYAFCREYCIEAEYFINVCCYEKEDFPEEVTYLTFSHILS